MFWNKTFEKYEEEINDSFDRIEEEISKLRTDNEKLREDNKELLEALRGLALPIRDIGGAWPHCGPLGIAISVLEKHRECWK